MTGRNHHANGMAAITELATGYPGYNGIVPFENGMLSEILLEHGYATVMVGPEGQSGRSWPGRRSDGREPVVVVALAWKPQASAHS